MHQGYISLEVGTEQLSQAVVFSVVASVPTRPWFECVYVNFAPWHFLLAFSAPIVGAGRSQGYWQETTWLVSVLAFCLVFWSDMMLFAIIYLPFIFVLLSVALTYSLLLLNVRPHILNWYVNGISYGTPRLITSWTPLLEVSDVFGLRLISVCHEVGTLRLSFNTKVYHNLRSCLLVDYF